MKNLGQLMKQAQAMQSRMAEMQAELERVEMTGQAGGGMVKVTLNGIFTRVFTTRGTFHYNCFVHPGMNGDIVVQ